jgi:hypothetical protein
MGRMETLIYVLEQLPRSGIRRMYGGIWKIRGFRTVGTKEEEVTRNTRRAHGLKILV